MTALHKSNHIFYQLCAHCLILKLGLILSRPSRPRPKVNDRCIRRPCPTPNKRRPPSPNRYIIFLTTLGVLTSPEMAVLSLVWYLLLLEGLLTQAYRPLMPQNLAHLRKVISGDVGEPLFLTPFIESGDLALARQKAKVSLPLPGQEPTTEVVESYAGFLTVNKNTNGSMFFWFFPATEVPPEEAPVVIWLQGGPGASSLFGLFELHGPYSAVTDSHPDHERVKAVPNHHSWTKVANLIYIDNPIGAGFSFCDTAGCLPRNLAQASDDLYSALLQWFTLFPEFQHNPFYPFGESYAGKFVPGIAKKIHDENPGAGIKINLQGMGIGDGFMSPPDSSIYAEYLYALGLVDGVKLDELLMVEADMKRYAAQEDWVRCFETWSQEFDNFLRSMGCSYYYGVDLCVTPAEEDDYEWLVDDDRTRKAIHVGGKSFGAQSSEVYYAMQEDFMQSARPIIEFLLEHYKILMYNGNMDIICNHFGILKMFDAMTEWSGRDEFKLTTQLPYMVQGHTAGYLKVVHNLRLLVMRNAGHMVPRSQPEYSLQMFRQFISGLM